MILVQNFAMPEKAKNVTVDEKLFNGDINEFIEIILRTIIPGISDNKLKNMVGKFSLLGSDNIRLNSGILEYQLTEEKIREELNKKNVVLKLYFAPLSVSSSIKNSEGLPTVFAQGAVKSVKKTGGKKSVKKKGVKKGGKKKSVKKGGKKKSVKKRGKKKSVKKRGKKKSVKKGGKKDKKKSVKKGGKKRQ